MYFTVGEEYYKVYVAVIQQLMAGLKMWSLILASACLNVGCWADYNLKLS